jgi:hypothetical protein
LAAQELEDLAEFTSSGRKKAREWVFSNDPDEYIASRESAHVRWQEIYDSKASSDVFRLATDDIHVNENLDLWNDAAEADRVEADLVLLEMVVQFSKVITEHLGPFTNYMDAQSMLRQQHPDVYNQVRVGIHERWRSLAKSAPCRQDLDSAGGMRATVEPEGGFIDDEEQDFARETDEEGDESTGDDGKERIRKGSPGRLPKELRQELDQLEKERQEKIKVLAQKYSRTETACMNYLSEDSVKVPREVNTFNAFKHYRREHGPHEGVPSGTFNYFFNEIVAVLIFFLSIELSAYTAYITNEYMDTLRSRLSEEDMKDSVARRQAMKVEIDFYQEHLNNFVQGAKDTGRVKPMVHRMVKPVLNLVCS